MRRTTIMLLPLLLLAVGAVIAVVQLQSAASAAGDSQLRLTQLEMRLSELQDIPWGGTPGHGGSPEEIRQQFEAAAATFERALDDLRREGVADAELTNVRRPFQRTIVPLRTIIPLANAGEAGRASEAAGAAREHTDVAIAALEAARQRYDAHADRALRWALYGSAAAITILFLAFAFFARRAAAARDDAERLADEVRALLEVTTEQATTDALTGLGNLRALRRDLAALERQSPENRLVLAVLDLDGFKIYNDTYGHPAGDALLTRLGHRLSTTVAGLGTAYRMGGDEFCVLAVPGPDGAEAIVRLAAAALTEEGEGFRVGCSFGLVELPGDTTSAGDALALADQRMYEQKASGRASAGRQSTDVLIQVLGERGDGLERHVDRVARLAEKTARLLRLPDQDVHTIRTAAELHDIGKVAIPDAILVKPGPLSDEEWMFMRRHTLIGERIALAAPSLAHTAALIRSSHERVDGGGYPDGLRGDAIPLGARIIAVCDAYDAMVSDRPYSHPMSREEALADLRRCAGAQFDQRVVDVFSTALAGVEATTSGCLVPAG